VGEHIEPGVAGRDGAVPVGDSNDWLAKVSVAEPNGASIARLGARCTPWVMALLLR